MSYLHEAEVLSAKTDDKLMIGKVYLTKAMFEMREDQSFTALDSLYLALAHFTEVEVYIYAYNCLLPINRLESECKNAFLARKKELLTDLEAGQLTSKSIE